MKNLHQNLFEDLKNLCLNLNDLQFCLKSELLNQATIGKHLRHSIEFYLCLIQGIPSRTVNYDNKQREQRIETDRLYAFKILSVLSDQLKIYSHDHSLNLFINETSSDKPFETSVNIELQYCLDHAIHHQSLIKVGLKELNLSNLVGSHFGVGHSPLKYESSLEKNQSSF